jgi:hypothetical protein
LVVIRKLSGRSSDSYIGFSNMNPSSIHISSMSHNNKPAGANPPAAAPKKRIYRRQKICAICEKTNHVATECWPRSNKDGTTERVPAGSKKYYENKTVFYTNKWRDLHGQMSEIQGEMADAQEEVVRAARAARDAKVTEQSNNRKLLESMNEEDSNLVNSLLGLSRGLKVEV